MKAEILNGQAINISSLEELTRLVPNCYSGVGLNYGQGEGQVKILDTVWGFYLNSEYNYYLQFEEGSLDLSKFIDMVNAIQSHLQKLFGNDLVLKVDGMFNGQGDI
ncbi:hypothetical protein L9G15_06140 [Shewanella sp. A3A]|nr:hypothetical protein [Shewanella ferrihydritica]